MRFEISKSRNGVLFGLFIFGLSACGGEEALNTNRATTTVSSNSNNQATNNSNTNTTTLPGSKFTTLTIGTQVTSCDANANFTRNFNETASMYNTGLAVCPIDLDKTYGCSVSNLRGWLGHSVGGAIITGFSREQQFAFTNLVPNQKYSLKVFIVGSRGVFKARAYVSDGEISSGSTYDIALSPNVWGCSPVGEFWEIQFSSKGTSAVIKLTNDKTSDIAYFYPSHYVISKM